MITDRSLLRDALNEVVVPKLLAQGFEGNYLKGNSRSYDFKRVSGDNEQTCIFIFDKYGKGRCAIQLEIGLNKLSYEDNGKLRFKVGYVRRKRLFGKIFEFRSTPSLVDRLRGTDREALLQTEIHDLVAILPEIEAWWHNPEGSDHIEAYDETY